MVMQLERIISVAELLARGAKTVKALRAGDNGEAATVIQAECNRIAKQIVSGSRRRAAASRRARNQTRSSSGTFG